MPSEMSDEEVICAWMEPRPETPAVRDWLTRYSDQLWWVLTDKPDGSPAGWLPGKLTLDRLRLVEERLTEEQWARYGELHFLRAEALCGGRDDFRKGMLHASAAEKIRALAAVIRESAGKGTSDAE